MAIALLIIVALPLLIAAGLVGYTLLNTHRAERLVPREGRFVEVGGARLHYVEQGQGPAILMVHGLGGQLRNFTYALTDRLAIDHRVIAVDRPGSGHSVAAPGLHPDLAGQAALIVGVIDALGLDRPLLVGHSLGGAIALAVALDHPEKIAGIALIAPLTHPLEGKISAAFKALLIPSPIVRRIVGWTLAAPLGHRHRAAGLRLVFGPEPAPADYESKGGGALSLRPSNFFAASSEASQGMGEIVGLAARYPTLRVPIAILFGRGDRILDPDFHGRRLAEAAPGATLELIDGGHMIPLTRARETDAWLRRFLGTLR